MKSRACWAQEPRRNVDRLNTGVYIIENVVNGRRYVGSALRISNRWNDHRRRLLLGTHHSQFLQRCCNKHGIGAFQFRTALFCDKQNLLMYEQALIDSFKPEYNTVPKAGSQLGFKHSPDTRAKMSASSSRIGNPGYRHSEETKRRISDKKKGRVVGPPSEETRAKISAAHKGRPCPPDRRSKISAALTGRTTGRGKLTEEQVREIRRLGAIGYGRIKIGRIMDIHPGRANSVLKKIAYLWVK